MLGKGTPQNGASPTNTMIIGVTGTLASGKSTVAKAIATAKNGKLLDADKIAHSVLDKNKEVYRQIVSFFGKQILNEKGKINRKRLADAVFSDRKKLKIICNIIHPEVISEIKKSTKSAVTRDKNEFVVIDAPLLIEAGLADFCDLIIVVTASISNILNRVRKHGGLNKKGALKRIRAQMPILEKKKYADYIISNDGPIKELKDKVNELMKKFE